MPTNIASTTTHIELVNRVLLNSAEQPVRTINETVAGKRASVSLQRAVRDIVGLGSWSFTRRGGTPTFNDIERTISHELTQVESVWFGEQTLKFVDWQDHAYAGYGDSDPLYWTSVNWDTIILAPYPTSVEQQSKVRVVGYSYPASMELDTDVSGLPEAFIDALVSRATGAFILRDHGDASLASQFNNEFEVAIQSLRDRDRGNPRRTGNMLFRPHHT